MGRGGGESRRDETALSGGLDAWGAARWGRHSWRVVELSRPQAGWSNETLILTVSGGATDGGEQRLVVRLPPRHPVFPDHDPRTEGAVLEAVAAGPVPVPRVVAVEGDEQWLGVPFLVMSFEPGRPGPEAPAVDPWLGAASSDDQRHLHEAFVDVLAGLHRVEWRGGRLDGVLRGGDGTDGLLAEVEWWADYAEWATDGSPPTGLAQALAWCRESVPDPGPAALCWGDARLGNVLVGEDFGITSLLDWEGAWLGPAESDLAWYLALEAVVERLTRRSVPGFLTRSELVARYERGLGRPVRDLPWHEVFALARSVAITERLARLAREGRSGYRGLSGPDNPVLEDLARLLDEAVGTGGLED